MKSHTPNNTRFQSLDLRIPEVFNTGLKQKLIKNPLFGNWLRDIKCWLFFPLVWMWANHLTFLNLGSFLCHVCNSKSFFFSFRNTEGSQVTRETFGEWYTVSDPQVPAVPVLVKNMDQGSFIFLSSMTWLLNVYQEKNESIRKDVNDIDVSTFSENGSLTLPHLELAIRVRASTIKCEAESFWSFSFKKLDLILDWVSKEANVCTEQTPLREDGGRKRWDRA